MRGVAPKVEEGVASLLGCVPSAAKSAGAPPAGAPPRKKPRNSDAAAINKAQVWCNRVAAGNYKKATVAELEAAAAGKALFKSGTMCEDQKKDFAHKMAESSKTKTYGWVKTFQSSWKVSRKETEEVTQNYFTRTVFACMHTCYIYIYIYIYTYFFFICTCPHEHFSIGVG